MIHISNPKDCCGCEACVQVCSKHCIDLHRDDMGFLYPHVNEELCIDCSLCEKVCPILHPFENKEPQQVFASKNTNANERKSSSSGGLFILLAKQVISHGGVVFGVTYDKEWNPVHSFSENMDGLAQFQGSKYVQSRIDGAYTKAKSFLDEGREVLFSGTPCQIAGLKHFLRKKYNNLLTVEVICHGVPSPGVWQDYLELIRRPQGTSAGNNTVLTSLNETPSIEGISFRDKQNGWRKFGFVVRFSDDQSATGKFGLSSVNAYNINEYHKENLYMKAFLNNLILRPSCFSCPAKAGKSNADISLGDFWSIKRFLKEWDDDGGVTLVYLNSDKGQDYFQHLACDNIELNPAIRYNKMYYESTSEKYPSEKFWEAYRQQGLKSILPISNSITSSKKTRFYQHVVTKLRRILKTIRILKD